MDKMAILAASTTEPSVALHQRSFSTLGPLQYAPQFQKTLGTVSFFVFVRTFFVAKVAVTSVLFASRIALVQAIIMSQFMAIRSATTAKWVSWSLWNSISARRLRKKLEYEFFTLVLGPGGNALFLVLFWPGWLAIAAIAWSIWSIVAQG